MVYLPFFNNRDHASTGTSHAVVMYISVIRVGALLLVGTAAIGRNIPGGDLLKYYLLGEVRGRRGDICWRWFTSGSGEEWRVGLLLA